MTHEGIPAMGDTSPETHPGLFSDADMLDRFGIEAAPEGSERPGLADQEFVYGKFKGTLRQMLSDPECPAAEKWQAAHVRDPENGVNNRITRLVVEDDATFLDTTLTDAFRSKKN